MITTLWDIQNLLNDSIWLILPAIICLSQRLSHAHEIDYDSNGNKQTRGYCVVTPNANTRKVSTPSPGEGRRAHLLGENQSLAPVGVGGRQASDTFTEFLIFD